MKLREYSGATGEKGYTFYCPGCKHSHAIRTAAGTDCVDAPVWSFNGDMEHPTFAPSLLCYWPVYAEQPGPDGKAVEISRNTRCHSFLTAGMLQFLGDCPHDLAGQTIPLATRPTTYDD